MKRIIGTLLGLFLMASMAMAQQAPPPPPPGGGGMEMGMMRHGRMGAWWKNSDVAQQLKLSDQQKQQLEKTFNDYRLKLIDLRADVQKQEALLQPLLDNDQLDKGKIGSQVDSLIAARGKLEKANMMMHVDLRSILTTDQWKQLQSMRAERMKKMRDRWDDRRPGRNNQRRMMRPGNVQAPPAEPAAPPAQPAPPGENL